MVRVQKVLDAVKNWSLGSKPLSREVFQNSVSLLIEGLEEMKDESDGWDFPEEDEE